MWRAAERGSSFFMGDAGVHRALRKLVRALDAAGIPYAIAGAMALGAHGYERMTAGLDLLLTRDGLAAFKSRASGLGYVEKSKGRCRLRDTENDVVIEILIAGDFPGDRKPKPVAFPDPAAASVDIDGVSCLALPRLVELKLASGLSAPHRLKDLADVQELIKASKLPRDLAEKLDPSVRPKYLELWDAAASGSDAD